MALIREGAEMYAGSDDMDGAYARFAEAQKTFETLRAGGDRSDDTTFGLALALFHQGRGVIDGTRGTPQQLEQAAAAGGDGITAHLREDRRHIRDSDLERIQAATALPLNLEMAATEEMLEIALRHKPHAACIVPERREERAQPSHHERRERHEKREEKREEQQERGGRSRESERR